MKNSTEKEIEIKYPRINLKELKITLDEPFPIDLDYYKIV